MDQNCLLYTLVEDIQKYNELQVKKFVSAWNRCIEEGAWCTSLTKHGRGKGMGERPDYRGRRKEN
jgi:hypothetical protein